MSGFNGLGGRKAVGGVTRITGLGSVKVLAVNPSNEEFTEITGQELPYGLNYDKRNNSFLDLDVTPVSFLVYQPEFDMYHLTSFELGDKDVKTSSGKGKWIDKKGNITYFADSVDIPLNNPKMSWANYDKDSMRPLKHGEETLYAFMMSLANVTSSQDSSNFIEVMEANGCSFKELVSGSTKGLKEFINAYGDNLITVPFVIREKIVSQEDGSESTKHYQEIYTRKPEVFFSGEVQDYHKDRFQTLIDKDNANGRSFINNRLYTIDLQPFNKDKCIGNVPSEPTEVSDDWI